MDCAIVGVGETRYVRGSGVSTLHLGTECALNAIRDALTSADPSNTDAGPKSMLRHALLLTKTVFTSVESNSTRMHW